MAQFVLQRQVFVAMYVPDIRIAREPAQCLVFIHQVVETVAIAARSVFAHTRHLSSPHLDAPSSHTPADTGKSVLVQESDHLRTKRLVCAKVLEGRQLGQTFVPGLEVQGGVLEAYVAEFPLLFTDLSRVSLATHCRSQRIESKWIRNRPDCTSPHFEITSIHKIESTGCRRLGRH